MTTNWAGEIAQQITHQALELEHLRTDLAAGLQSFKDGIRLRGARPVDVGPTGTKAASRGTGRLVGWSLAATGGDVLVTLRDDRGEGGDTLAVIALSEGTSESTWLGPGGVSYGEGVNVVVAGDGTLEGAVWLGAVD